MKLVRYLLTISILCIITYTNGNAAFQNLDVGARPLGMAGAFVCVADDANAVYWNVSGLKQVNKAELTAMYSRAYSDLIDGISLNFAAFVCPIGKSGVGGTMGIGYICLGSELYQENIFTLSYSNSIPLIKNLFVGLNFKYMQKGYLFTEYMAGDKTFENGRAADGIGVDLGVMYGFNNNISLSYFGKNINNPDIHLKRKDIVPAEHRIGLGVKLHDIVVDIEGVALDNANRDRKIICGSEIWLADHTIALRGGFGVGIVPATKDYRNVALGASYNLNLKIINVQIDYGINYSLSNLVSDSTANHFFSCSLKY